MTARAAYSLPSEQTTRVSSHGLGPHDRLAVLQHDAGGAGGLQQHVEQVAAVDDEIGRAEGAQEPVTEVRRDQALTRAGIRDDDPGGCDTDVEHGVEHPEPAQDAGRIGSQLQARAHFGEALGAFENAHGAPVASQSKGSRQPADAASDDDDLACGLSRPLAHRVPPCQRVNSYTLERLRLSRNGLAAIFRRAETAARCRPDGRLASVTRTGAATRRRCEGDPTHRVRCVLLGP